MTTLLGLLIHTVLAAQLAQAIEPTEPDNARKFTIHLTDGSMQRGPITDWQADQLSVGTGDSAAVVALARIARIDGAPPEPAAKTHVALVGLSDGSQIAVHDFSFDEKNESKGCQMRYRHSQWSLATRQIRFVRFRKPSDALRAQWNELVHDKHQGDVLVVRRSADSIDSLDGVIRSVGSDKVHFELDDELIPVEIEKLEGIIFYGSKDLPSDRVPTIRFSFGPYGHLNTPGRLNARSAIWNANGELLEIVTESGATLPLSLWDVERADLTSGRMTYLSSLSPSRESVQPSLESNACNDALIQLLYSPRRDEDFSGQPMALRYPSEGKTRTYSRGLAIHSRTRLVYRLNGKFRKLFSTVGLAPAGQDWGSVQLSVMADGETLFECPIERRDEPVELDLPIENCDMLTILVDDGGDGDTGDRLHMCDLRVVK